MRLLIIPLFLAISTWAGAQEFPNPKPGPAHEMLAMDAGTWDCEVKMYFQGPDGPATEFKGVAVNVLVSGDLYLKSEFTCQMGERKFEAHSLMGYDAEAKHYTGVWVDNFTVTPAVVKGEYDETTKTYTESRKVVSEAGQAIEQKAVMTWTGDAARKTEVFWVLGEGLEVKIMEMTATKRE